MRRISGLVAAILLGSGMVLAPAVSVDEAAGRTTEQSGRTPGEVDRKARHASRTQAFGAAPAGRAPTTSSGRRDADPQPACPSRQDRSGPPRARCLVLFTPDIAANRAAVPGAEVQPSGHGAGDIAAAYNLPIQQGQDQTVAVVAAYDAPTAEEDLAVYRETYGLPPCTAESGCFTKVNQQGESSPLPPPDDGWAVEISLDLDMVSAACPRCDILLVEANSPSLEDLGAAVDTAAEMGADVISNSYGLEEFADMSDHAGHYDHPKSMITVAAGNDGYGPASFPAVLSTVTAVGGTELKRDSNPRGWTETAWQSSGSACSEYIEKPAWQRDPGCDMRTIADVSALAADVAVYDTYQQPGWLTVSGTSVATPIIAGAYALAGNAARIDPSYPYEHRDQLFDITSGSSGECGATYLCTAVPGYDGPTGLGTPDGVGAFTAPGERSTTFGR